MLRYVGNPETVHFANWLIHTDLVDLDALIQKSQKLAVDDGKDNVWEDGELLDRAEYLAPILGVVLAEQAIAFHPDYNHFDGHEYGDCSADYEDGNAFYLFAPLLSAAIDQIDLLMAAVAVLIHIEEVEVV